MNKIIKFFEIIFEIIFQCCDRLAYPVIISILGNMLMAISLLLIGPMHFLNLAPSKNLLFICGTLMGLGCTQVVPETNIWRGRLQKCKMK